MHINPMMSNEFNGDPKCQKMRLMPAIQIYLQLKMKSPYKNSYCCLKQAAIS
jgi:hypothetical protein